MSPDSGSPFRPDSPAPSARTGEPLMTRIPLVVICCVTLFVVVGEILCGTDLYVALAVGPIFVAIGLTYNLLGGLRTISGILFAEFALRTIVLSQFFKIFLREPADLNLEAPHLTITVYLIFYCCLAVASVFFGRLRLPLPRPIEARTQAQTHILYWISLVAGALGTAMFDLQDLNPAAEKHLTASHSIGLALSNLLFFAMVLAIDERIRKTDGRHSAGWAVLVPTAILWASAFVTTSREGVLGTVILWGIVCYFRGYRFGKRHLFAGVAFALFFLFVYSPFELYSRTFVGNLYFTDRAAKTVQVLEQHPNLTSMTNSVDTSGGWAGGRGVGYLNGTRNNALQRPTLVWEDSALISACASGFRYGWTSIEMDLVYSVPRLVNPHKPDDDASPFVGRVSGLNPDDVPDGKVSNSAIADSFGAFGIPGVIVLGLFIVPLFFAVFRNIFDLRTVWGTVALGMTLTTFGEWRTGQFLLTTVYQPIYLIALSWILNAVGQLIPTRGETALPPLPSASSPLEANSLQ